MSGRLVYTKRGSFAIAAFLFFAIIWGTGCSKKKEEQKFVVKAGDKYLTGEQLVRLVPAEFVKVVDESQWVGLANGWLSEVLLVDFARKLGLDKDTVIVERINRVTNTILIESIREKLRTQIQVPDTEVENFYRSNSSEFILDESMIRAFVIVVSEKEIADTLRKKINNIDDFKNYAKNYSDDFSQSDSCDMGWFYQSQILPSFASALFKPDTAHLIGPIQENGRFYLFWIVERLPSNTVCPFELVKEQIREQLLEEKTNLTLTKLLDSLIIVSASFIDTNAIKEIADSLKR